MSKSTNQRRESRIFHSGSSVSLRCALHRGTIAVLTYECGTTAVQKQWIPKVNFTLCRYILHVQSIPWVGTKPLVCSAAIEPHLYFHLSGINVKKSYLSMFAQKIRKNTWHLFIFNFLFARGPNSHTCLVKLPFPLMKNVNKWDGNGK
jgi:hypothetical protein